MPQTDQDDLPLLAETIIREMQLARWERRIERAIETALAGMLDEMLADLRAVVAAGTVIPGAWEQLLVAEVRKANKRNSDEIVAAIKAPAPGLMVAFGGYDFDAQEARLLDRVVDMTADLADAIGTELHVGTAGGESFDKLRDRVRSVFDSSQVRARRIARTEVISAANGAQHATASNVHSTGNPMTKTWLATFDRRTRETHLEAHGQTVAFDQQFEVGGAMLEYPGDPSGPPEEVINCRCTVTYEMLDVEGTGDRLPDEEPGGE